MTIITYVDKWIEENTSFHHSLYLNYGFDGVSTYKTSGKSNVLRFCVLTNWVRVAYICVSGLTMFGSDNGLSPIWTNAGIMLIGPWGQTSVKSQAQFIHFYSRKCIWKCCLRMAVILSWPQCVNFIYLRIMSIVLMWTNYLSLKFNKAIQSEIYFYGVNTKMILFFLIKLSKHNVLFIM